jgi:hypothetical protein
MRKLTKTLAVAIATAATFAGAGAAATLVVGSQSLAAGSAAVAPCTGLSSLTATRNVNNAGNVTRVNVGGIPSACSGETFSVTLVGTAKASLGTGAVTLGGCAATCTATVTSFGATVSAANVTGYSFGTAGA